MQRETIRILKATVITGLLATLSAQAELVRNPTQIGTAIDLGEIVHGTLYDGSESPAKTEGQVITRTGVYLTESGVYNERLTVQLTIGGLFWFSLPEDASFQTRRIQFGPGVGQAQGVYAFGSDPKAPVATLQFGLFPHKYSESKNLGEYLFRSGTYPGTLVTGGWSYLNAASYMAEGFHFSVPMLNGKLNHELTLYIERDLEPTNDLSPGYLITAKPVPFLELGAGIVWSHALSFNSKRLTPKVEGNSYSKRTGKPMSGAVDTATLNTPSDEIGYYTFKGFKTMGRASADIGMLLGVDAIKAGDFKLYSEIALLGIEDQPYYYDDKMERMPIMGGINIPTFGILDGLSVEVEYKKSRFPNTNGSVLQNQLPIPINNGENPYVYDLSDPRYAETIDDDNDPATPNVPNPEHVDPFTKSAADAKEFAKKDDWKWSVYARRHLTEGFNVYAQVANDHSRHFNFQAIPAAAPATSRPSEWYYVLRLEFGI